MDNNQLLTLLIAFVLGYFAHQMMGNMCRGRLVEGGKPDRGPKRYCWGGTQNELMVFEGDCISGGGKWDLKNT